MVTLIVMLNAATIKSQSDNMTVVIEGQETTVDDVVCATADWRVRTQMLVTQCVACHVPVPSRALTTNVRAVANQLICNGHPSRPDKI